MIASEGRNMVGCLSPKVGRHELRSRWKTVSIRYRFGHRSAFDIRIKVSGLGVCPNRWLLGQGNLGGGISYLIWSGMASGSIFFIYVTRKEFCVERG